MTLLVHYVRMFLDKFLRKCALVDRDIECLSLYECFACVPNAFIFSCFAPRILHEIVLTTPLVLGDTLILHSVVVGNGLVHKAYLASLLCRNELYDRVVLTCFLSLGLSLLVL